MNHQVNYVHEKTFTIAWGDMDALGHVNNGKYFDYFQEARIEWLQSLNFDLKQDKGPVVVHVACTFLKPVVYPATLTIKSNLQHMGRSSMEMHHELYQGATLMAEGISRIVWVDYQSNKSHPLPEEIRSLFERKIEK
ncbi:acyl-CoA thioesterase [Legionella impletisoli]|uniref:Thioesterase n=1 Tax=Legionella impletisoli TaxID=343510 RepID=A0A917JVC0_9GAMM|nr:thioesterase family protein [Legionella impletisoli]GGI86755.1 thioesterase [Legionella impletisoli]